jgi:hypothetical protein
LRKREDISMKRSIKKIVLGLVFGAMLVPSSYVWAKTGRTNTEGQWKMEEKHWTFLNEQGNKLTGWIVSNEEWYYLGENGNMKTGWLLDNGKWYFLSTEMSAKTGRALTGWQWIDGYCYFFSTVDDNSLGILYVNRMTPDGYHVNQSGQWIDEKGEAYYIAGKGFASKQVAGASRPIPETAVFSGSSTGVNPGRGSSGSVGASLGTPETKQLKPAVPEKEEEKKPEVSEKVEEKKPEEKKPEAVEEKKPEVPEEVEDKKLEEIPQNLVLAHKKNEFYELYYLYFGKRKYNEKIHSYIEKVYKVEINGTVYNGVIYGEDEGDVDLAGRKNSYSKIAEGAETESKVNALALTKDAFKEGESNKVVIRAEGYKDYEGTLVVK